VYKKERLSHPPEVDLLNSLGEDGWQLCGVFPSWAPYCSQQFVYDVYFKRQAGPVTPLVSDMTPGELAAVCGETREEVNAERTCGCGGSDKLGHGENCKGWPWPEGKPS
jgi:hypothetical protein